ncbi:MAG: hypothetical protein Q4D57_03815 [Clostridia bacterium]|nr:hypothetical protein [Clostridia bacterium]
MGFTEKEVGHFTIRKWLLLFKELKKMYNSGGHGGGFKPKTSNVAPNGWIPF